MSCNLNYGSLKLNSQVPPRASRALHFSITRYPTCIIKPHYVITQVGSSCGCHHFGPSHMFADLDADLTDLQGKFSCGNNHHCCKKEEYSGQTKDFCIHILYPLRAQHKTFKNPIVLTSLYRDTIKVLIVNRGNGKRIFLQTSKNLDYKDQ